MNFIGHVVSVKSLETVAKRFGRGASTSAATDLYKVTVADAGSLALAEQAKAEEAEKAVDVAREAAARRKDANDLKRQRLADEARQARAAADDAPSRRGAREQDATAERAERAIAELDEDDRAAEAEIEPLQHHACRARRYAHEARARALRVFRDALYVDAQIAVNAAQSAAEALKRKLERAGFTAGEM